MPETQQTTQDVAGVTRSPTGTIADQNPTLTQPSTESPPQQDQLAEGLKASTTTPSSETSKTETKTDGKSAAPAQSLLNEESPEPKGAPEKYEDFTFPEGFTLDEEVKGEVTTTFKELDLNQSGAQKLMDLYVKHTQEALQAPYDAYIEQRKQWRDQVNANPEIGGSKLNTTRASIGKLIGRFGKYAEGFKKAMNDTGAGDHPDVIGGLYELSKILNESAAVRGNGPSPEGQRMNGQTQPTAAQAMYPHLTSNR